MQMIRITERGIMMLQQERFQIIKDEVRRQSAVTVHDLAIMMNVSESTVRRDISSLDDAGEIKKVFGGAVAIDKTTDKGIIARESGMAEKSMLFVEEKRAIGKYAASLIEDDDFIFIDAGTTTGFLIENLENRKATYVTNGMRHAIRLSELGFRSYILAGQAKYLTEAIAGTLACESMRRYGFTKSFIGTNGIDIKKGLTTPDIEEAMVKEEAVRRSAEAYILTDSSKFGAVSSVSFADIGNVTIITDKCPDKKYEKKAKIIAAAE